MWDQAGQAVMMTLPFAESMPVLDHPLSVPYIDGLHAALVCFDRIVAAPRECASQVVMMTSQCIGRS